MDRKIEPKWDPTKVHGQYFSVIDADKARIFKKSLLPLDRKPLQSKTFLRGNNTGSYFSVTVGSVI